MARVWRLDAQWSSNDLTRLPTDMIDVAYGYTTRDTLEQLGGSTDFTALRLIVRSGADDAEHIKEVVREVRDKAERAGLIVLGETVISPGLASRVLAEFALQDRACGQATSVRSLPATAPTPDTARDTSDYAAPPVELTERQVEVLTMVAQGYTYPEIGELLHLSKHTIRYHMREIISQLHFKNRAEIIAFVQQQGLMKEA
jgi:DNA-binding NarL/FixJ family response regulator